MVRLWHGTKVVLFQKAFRKIDVDSNQKLSLNEAMEAHRLRDCRGSSNLGAPESSEEISQSSSLGLLV